MKRFFFLVWMIFWATSSWATTLPLEDLFQSLGLCQQEVESRQDYAEFQGQKIYGVFFRCPAQGLRPQDLISPLREGGFEILFQNEEALEARKPLKEGFLYLRLVTGENLTLVRQTVLRPGESRVFEFSEEGESHFYLDSPRGSYLCLRVEVPKGAEVKISASDEFRHRRLKQKVFFHRILKGEETDTHLLYSLPLVPGLQHWSLSISQPGKVVLSLREEGHLVAIPSGDRLGGILLHNVPYGRARVRPETGAEYLHPLVTEADYVGDLTPQGDAIFWLPPGFWQLQVDPLRGERLDYLKAHLIPVFPGYLTEVSWPASLARLFEGRGNVRLEILSFGEEDGKGYVDFALLNLETRDLEPRKGDFSVLEAGIPGKVLSVSRLKSPPRVVILLDSSGSMKGSMNKALQATERFLKGLPPESRVTLIDFDTKPKELGTGTPKEVLPLLAKVRANGATALYDAVLLGLSYLKGANRPTLILFTDGRDANWNDTGPGSKASQEEVFEAVREADVPIFTIGFGENPDFVTLSRLSALTGAEYYSAADSEALNRVFQRIQHNLGHQWRLVYERPKQAGPGEKPVLALVVDNSGSMEGRLEKVRQILHDFVLSLPDGFLVQLFVFSNSVMVKQVLTDDKLSLLRGLAEMEPLSGTDILGSLEGAYHFLHAVPSTRRYLLYLTDEALKVDEDQQERFDLLLQQLKDDGVKSLFVGMVETDEGGVFARAAQLAEGEAVIAPTPETLKEALNRLLSQMGVPSQEEGHLLRLVFKHTDRFGRTNLYSAAEISRLPLPVSRLRIRNPEAVVWKKGEELRPYGGELARLVTGEGAIGREVRVLKRIPLQVSAENKAVKVTLHEAVFLSRLRGVEPPSGRFLALILTLENILKPQEVVVYPDGSAHPAAWVSGASARNARVVKKVPDYLIPDARLHFFLSWNNQTSFPVSPATYLAETPLILPDENAILVPPGHPVTGTLIFEVPEEFMQQSALHLFDTAYGHLDLPISGVLQVKSEQIKRLPLKTPAKLSETFTIQAEGYRDIEELYGLSAASGNVFRVLDLTLVSKIQAHLAVEPSQRFFLFVDTEKGPFVFRLHPVTQRVPLGFYRPRLVTPGSFNRLRLVFEIPKALADNAFRLLIDVKGGPVSLPLSSFKLSQSGASLAMAQAQGAKLVVNGAYIWDSRQKLVLDVTIIDEKDETATALSSFLALSYTEEARNRLKKVSSASDQTSAKGLAGFARNQAGLTLGDVLPQNEGYLVELPWETIVLNGQSRRGLVFFDLPEGTRASDFVLVSSVFKDLSLPLSSPSPFPFEDLLTEATEYEEDRSFEEALERALERLTRAREARGFVKPGSLKVVAATLDGTPPKGVPVSPPSLLVSGGKSWKEISSLSELQAALRSLKLYPSNWRAWQVVYAPEAVFTQGWLTENEMASLAERILNRQGLETRRLVAVLSERGKEKVQTYFAKKKADLFEVPALSYEDEEGRQHTLVFPFFEEAQRLPGSIKSLEEATLDKPSLTVEVIVEARLLSSGQSETAAEIASALAGEEEESLEELTLLSEKISLEAASLDALDLGFVEGLMQGRGRVIRAILDSPEGRKVGEEVLELRRYQPVGIKLKFYTPRETYETYRPLLGQWPTEVFFVIGANVPDLPKERLALAESSWQKAHQQAQNPDAISSLKWMGRGVIARFVGAQTSYEKVLAQKTGLLPVRLRDPRILVVTFYAPSQGSRPQVSFDLVQPYPQWRGPQDEVRKLNLLAGFYYSQLEAEAIPGGINAFRLFSLWPEGTKLLLLAPDTMDEFAETLKKTGYPRYIWKHFEEGRNFVLFPDRPLVLGKKLRLAWIEIDPDHGYLFSFLDTGERGVTEYALGEDVSQVVDFLAGAWMGVQVSVWSVAGFSLVLDDWQAIKTCAHGFARQMADYLGAVLSPKDTASPEGSKVQAALSGDVPGAIGLSNFDYGCVKASELEKTLAQDAEARAWSSDDIQGIFDGAESLQEVAKNGWDKAKEKYLGFVNGFKLAVEWYFNR